MKEYDKILNIFNFSTDYKSILGLNPKAQILKDLKWVGTEKVDGTNIRVHWDGHKIEIAGRTDNAQFQGDSKKFLDELFINNQNMEYLFESIFEDKEAFIFGECYGPKIQTGGGNYADSPQFIVFDIQIGGYDLNRQNVNDVANKLGLKSVPTVFVGNLDEAIEFVKQHHVSTINAAHEMEGIVLQPADIQLYDNRGKLIKFKCKYRDMVKAGMVND